MNFSTLREAYNVDTFDRNDKKQKNKKKSRNNENVPSDYPRTERIEKVDSSIDIQQIEDKRKDTNELDDISDTKTIEPYYDEELEKYLNVKDFKNSGPYTPEDIISKEKLNTQYPIHYVEPSNQESLPVSQNVSNFREKDIFYKNVVNIGLFALIGILIIFLCDQIAEIAINQGMQKTIQILEPYLQNKIVI